MDPSEVRQDRVASNTTAPATGTGGSTTRPAGDYQVGNRISQLVWLIAGVVDAILALDFIFRAAGAHNTGFAHYIYRLSNYLASPFSGIFNTTTAANGASVMRWGDLIAIVVYAVAAWIVTKLVRIVANPGTGRSTA
jgi:hypothetical protein